MLQGKGMFIWRIRGCEGGDVNAIVKQAVQANFKHVLVKIADGNFTYNIDTKTGADLAAPLIEALQESNIQVYGWHYIYGYDPSREAEVAIRRATQLKVDGYVINAEGEFKHSGRDRVARQFMSLLKSGLHDIPVGLSSYRFPSLHRQFPWRDFLIGCDFNMPQVYWLKASNPGEQLKRSISDFQKISPFRPIIPTGLAFKSGTWSPTTQQIVEFLNTAIRMNLGAANFWEWSHCRKYLPQIWDVINNYDWPGDTQADISQQIISALNLQDIGQLMSLYHTDAIHVTMSHVLRGAQAIRDWYQTMFNQILPGGNYVLTNRAGNGSVRHMNWTASSTAGNIYNGSDTLGLVDGKISYHYSEFNVT